MKNGEYRKITGMWIGAFALCGLSLAFPLDSLAEGQADLLKQAQELNKKGNNDSEDRAVEKGFEALSDVAELNIPGAISNGTQAYNSYNNSREFDRISDESQNRKDSLGGGGAGTSSVSVWDKKALASMDHSRLYQGALGKAAERAEKVFGWSREEMFNVAVSFEAKVYAAKESGRRLAAGEFVEEAKRLISRVPNEEARKNLEKAAAIITPGMADMVIGRMEKDYDEAAGAARPGISPGERQTADPGNIPEAPAASPVAETNLPEPAGAELREPSSSPTELTGAFSGKDMLRTKEATLFMGLHSDSVPPEKTLQGMLGETLQEKTLFQRVSLKLNHFERTIQTGIPDAR